MWNSQNQVDNTGSCSKCNGMPTYLSQTKSGIISSRGRRFPNGLAVAFFLLLSPKTKTHLLFRSSVQLLSSFQILDSVANYTHCQEAKMGNLLIISFVNEICHFVCIMVTHFRSTLMWFPSSSLIRAIHTDP